MTSRLIQVSILLIALIAAYPANAVLIEITYPEQDIVRAALSEIDAVDDRVYTIRFLEDGTAEIVFGDGVAGARLPSDGSVVASYRYGDGDGDDGKIINEYPIFENELPLIPIEDFWPKGTDAGDASFVIAGLASMTFDFSPNGMRVIGAKSTPVPEPGTLALFGIGLLGMAASRRRKKV